MNETLNECGPPQPEIKKDLGVSLVWLIPLITALIGGWLVVKTLSEKGPRIEISFKTAEGIETGKTKVKFKEIEIGVVSRVAFSNDFSSVVLFVDMDKGTDHFLGRGTRFWVVKPRLTLRGASGLGTLLSGAYIEIEPGEGDPQTRFNGLDRPPVVKGEISGSKLMLVARHLGSLDTGSPIYYQGILAGEVLGWELGNDQKSIFVHAFVKAPYNRLVRGNTRFWNISGVNLTMDADGFSLKTHSLESLLYGGIAFETPETREPVSEDISELAFTLYDSKEQVAQSQFLKRLTCVLYFDGSVRGLAPDAPVEFKGIRVGRVKEIRLAFNREKGIFQIPVLVELEPERFLSDADPQTPDLREELDHLIHLGLRARLQTGSLLTGQLFVALDMHPEAPVRLQGGNLAYPELPTLPAQMAQMVASVETILGKMEAMDFDRISSELLGVITGARKVVNQAGKVVGKPEMQAAVTDFTQSLSTLRQILQKVDQRVEPIAVNLENAIRAGHMALEKTRTTMTLLDQALDPGAPLQFNLIELSGELSETARSIRALVDMLERDPDSLIFGKPVQAPRK